MAVGGVGGLFGQLFNPGLDDRLAQHITPNPNPLAQQGGPPGPKAVDSLGNPVPTQQPNLAPAAVTQPDPVNSSYAKDLMAASRRDANAAMFNEGLDQMAASFGTAQQQQSKQAALRHGGGVGSSLADLASIQTMQDQTIKDNEHARFMGNAAVFAQTLSTQLGRPVSVQEATEIMNSPDLMRDFSSAAGANATTTGTQKDAEAATRAWAAAHPEATAKDIADYKASLIAGGMGGGNIEDQQYLAYARTERAAGRSPVDIETWKLQHKQAATEAEDAHKVALQLPGLKSQLTTMDQTADSINPDDIKGIFGNISKQDAARQIFNYDPSKGGMDPATLYGDGRTLTREEVNAVIAARKLHLANYAANFKEAGSGQRLSQQEATRLGAASDTLGTFSGSIDDYMGRVHDVKNKIAHSMANAHGEARDLDSLPIQYRSKIDISFLEGPNALKNLPTWARPVSVNSKADIDELPDGQAYKPTSGHYAGKILFKGQEAGYEDY